MVLIIDMNSFVSFHGPDCEHEYSGFRSGGEPFTFVLEKGGKKSEFGNETHFLFDNYAKNVLKREVLFLAKYLTYMRGTLYWGTANSVPSEAI